MAVSSYKLENNVYLYKNAKKCVLKMRLEKCEKMVKNVGKQEITCFNTFPNLNQIEFAFIVNLLA
jgi:hypothetical protein